MVDKKLHYGAGAPIERQSPLEIPQHKMHMILCIMRNGSSGKIYYVLVTVCQCQFSTSLECFLPAQVIKEKQFAMI